MPESCQRQDVVGMMAGEYSTQFTVEVSNFIFDCICADFSIVLDNTGGALQVIS